MMPRKLTVAAAATFSLMAGHAFAQQLPTAYFSFVSWSTHTANPHEFIVGVTNPVVVDKLREIIAGTYQGGDTHIQGRIVPTRTDYNEEWSFHLDPDTVDTFEIHIEHCDATPFLIENKLALVGKTDPNDPDAGFLKNSHWCPYTSRVVREIDYPGGDSLSRDAGG